MVHLSWAYGPAALRNVPRLIRLDASILPSNALPVNCPFQLESFTHNHLVIGLDAVQFFSQQPRIKELTLNPFSYYEVSVLKSMVYRVPNHLMRRCTMTMNITGACSIPSYLT